MTNPQVQTGVSHHSHHSHHRATQHTGQGQVPSGMLQGQPVQQLSHASVLANAADELSQQLSSKAEEKNLRDRRLGSTRQAPALSRKQLHELMQHLHEGAQNEEQRNQGLMELGRRIQRNPGQARQEVARQSGQASEQYLSLLEVAELLREGALGPDVGGRTLEAVLQAAAELEVERGDAIWADVNTVQAATDHALHSGEAGAAGAFRQTYRDAVLGADDLAQTLRHVLQTQKARQGADFQKVLDSMVSALGMDLTAARPSSDPVRLQALVSDLYHLGVVASVIDTCAELGTALHEQHGVPVLQASGLTSDLVGLSAERWVDATRFESLARQHQCDAPLPCQVAFMAGVRNALKDLPLQVFASTDARDAVLEASQRALDRSIDLEAEEHEQ